MKLTPRPSIVEEKRIVSSWTRWEAPSIGLIFAQSAHVVVVHRGAPAEDVVADEEPIEHADRDGDEGDSGDGCKLGSRIRRPRPAPAWPSAFWIRL